MKTIKKLTVILLLIAATVAAISLAINIFVIASTQDRIFSGADDIQNTKNFDCILILGAGLRPDGSPSSMLKERLECGYRLYKHGVSEKILVSGDHGTTEYDEVNAMKSYLISKGVPGQDIFMDHAGFSTYDSIYRAKKIFMCEKICVVTQKYHLYRALYIAKGMGLDAIGTDAQAALYRGYIMREIRECAARVKDFFAVPLGIMPKFLGDEIPISGDGNFTNDK